MSCELKRWDIYGFAVQFEIIENPFLISPHGLGAFKAWVLTNIYTNYTLYLIQPSRIHLNIHQLFFALWSCLSTRSRPQRRVAKSTHHKDEFRATLKWKLDVPQGIKLSQPLKCRLSIFPDRYIGRRSPGRTVCALPVFTASMCSGRPAGAAHPRTPSHALYNVKNVFLSRFFFPLHASYSFVANAGRVPGLEMQVRRNVLPRRWWLLDLEKHQGRFIFTLE